MGIRKVSLWTLTAAVGAAVACGVVVALPAAGFAARGVLAGVLAFAGQAKLRDRAPFAGALSDLGVPPLIVPAVAVTFPLLELALGAMLLVPATTHAGALAALALLLLLSALMVNLLARGAIGDCGCFGKDHSAPSGATTLVRNGLLVGLAAAVAGAGAARDPVFGLSPAWTAALAAAVALAAASMILTRSNEPQTAQSGLKVHLVSGDATALTRRTWVRTAAAAGLAGTFASWLEASPADAVLSKPTASDQIVCTGGCQCCALVVTASGPVCRLWCCSGCTGFSGGGSVQTPSGTAQASFSGTKVKQRGKQQLIVGGLTWFDPGWHGTGLHLQSTGLTHYGPVAGTKMRELVGFASANGNGKHKFVLRVLDGGAPGSGNDAVRLTVTGVPGGGAGGSGSDYIAQGHLVQGNITTSLNSSTSAT